MPRDDHDDKLDARKEGDARPLSWQTTIPAPIGSVCYCPECEGTGLARGLTVQCSACNGTGEVWDA